MKCAVGVCIAVLLLDIARALHKHFIEFRTAKRTHRILELLNRCGQYLYDKM